MNLQAQDSLFLKKNQILILKDKIIASSRDTLIILEDPKNFKVKRNPYRTSDAFYRKLSEKSESNKITKKFADLFLVRTDKSTDAAASAGLSNDVQFNPYEGLVIRSISIRHVDILEGSVYDTTRVSSSRYAVLANRTHTDSRDRIIRSNLRIREGQRIDPVLMADNERILRRVGYVEDAKIYVLSNPQDFTADVVIYVKDRLSWGFEGHFSNQNQADFRLFNRNIAGFGRYGSFGTYYKKSGDPELGTDFRFGGQNSNKTITNWEVNETNYWARNDRGLLLQKDFLSQTVKYGGGFEIRSVQDSTLAIDGELGLSNFYKLTYQDFWAGRSFLLKSRNSQKNLIFSGRVLNTQFSTRPEVKPDSNSLYYNRVLFLGQAAIAKQRFIKASYVLGFGVAEDIPVGYRVSGIYGRDFNEFYTQDYLGTQIFWSKYYESIGYFYVSQEFGGFVQERLQDGVFRSQVSYFAPLLESGRSRIRLFINFGLVNGFKQSASQHASLSGRISDITGNQIAGNRIFYLKTESILFTPWYLIGFRFAPFVFGSYSHASDRRITDYFSSNYFSGGIGLRLKNESLVFNTLELRLTNFFKAPKDANNPAFTVSVSFPITFGDIFKYKPTLIPFE